MVVLQEELDAVQAELASDRHAFSMASDEVAAERGTAQRAREDALQALQRSHQLQEDLDSAEQQRYVPHACHACVARCQDCILCFVLTEDSGVACRLAAEQHAADAAARAAEAEARLADAQAQLQPLAQQVGALSQQLQAARDHASQAEQYR